jgi:hypothetical protein
MPLEESVLSRACGEAEALADGVRAALLGPVTPGVIDAGETAGLLARLVALVRLLVYAEAIQRAGHTYARVGHLPRDHVREYGARLAAD